MVPAAIIILVVGAVAFSYTFHLRNRVTALEERVGKLERVVGT